MSAENEAQVREILATVKPLAVEYYRLTGKPFGVTGEIAECVAAELLGLKLVPTRTIGYDALRGNERIQIKGRAYGAVLNPGARISRIRIDAPCDTVLLVLLDNATLEPRETPLQQVACPWNAGPRSSGLSQTRPCGCFASQSPGGESIACR